MISNTDTNQNEDFVSTGNLPHESKLSSDKLKSYGKKSLSPLVDLVHKYQAEIMPYFDAIAKGLQSGEDSLSGSENEAEKVVAGWFREAAGGLTEARNKFQSSNPQELIDYIETQAKNHPGFMFSSSYLAGLFFGRIGRHIGRNKFSKSSSEFH